MVRSNPLVSVVIPTFNRSGLAVQTLESLRRQTYPHWEAVAVDDGSSDDTCQRINALSAAEPRIHLLARNRPPKGAATCRNIGLAASRGDYVIFLDSDDLLAPTCLQRRVQALQQNPNASFVVFPSLFFREAPHDSMLLWNTSIAEPDLGRFLRGDSVWPINGPIWRKAMLNELGGCDESLACWQDVDLHVRALLRRPKYVKLIEAEPDGFIRRHQSGSISQGGLKAQEAVRSIARVFQKGCAASASADPDLQYSLRCALVHVLQLAMDSRQFDLAREALLAAAKSNLLTERRCAIWRFALRFYQWNVHHLLGGRLLRRKLTSGLRPPTTIGTKRYSAPADP